MSGDGVRARCAWHGIVEVRDGEHGQRNHVRGRRPIVAASQPHQPLLRLHPWGYVPTVVLCVEQQRPTGSEGPEERLSRSQQGPWGLASTRALTGIRRLIRIAPSRASTRRRHSETQLGGVSSRTPPSGSEEAPRRTGTPSPSRRPEAPYRRRPRKPTPGTLGFLLPSAKGVGGAI